MMRTLDNLKRAISGLIVSPSDLKALYVYGGILVSTTNMLKADDPTNDSPTILQMKTLIQPDADIITHIIIGRRKMLTTNNIQPDADVIMQLSREVFSQPDILREPILREHFAKLRSKVDSIRRLRMLINYFWLVVFTIFALRAFYNFVQGDFSRFVISLLLSAAISAVFFLLRRLLVYVFQWYLRWAIGRFARRIHNDAK